MKEELIFAGFGGQGIMFMGKLLSHVAMNNGKFVTWMPSYGAEVRGGTAHSMVVISDDAIASSVVKEPSVCVVMNRPSLKKFEPKVKPKGMLIINKSLVDIDAKRTDIDILEIPATEMAFNMGNSRVSNMIILGALLAKRDIVPIKSLMDSLTYMIPKKRKDMIRINQDAIRRGHEYCSR